MQNGFDLGFRNFEICTLKFALCNGLKWTISVAGG